MPLDLQLHRMVKLLQVLGNPHTSSWKAVHVAGTNGKGSVCAYLSQILTLSNIKNGRFTSPHMLYVNDCICVNNKPISPAVFETVQTRIMSVNEKAHIGATEFEILTCTAFEIFKMAEVEVAIIEVGLGGRLDATNVLSPRDGDHGVVATGITKIGMDHEGFLGSTLGAIAGEKAGIMKPGVPCVVDATNDAEAVHVFEKVAAKQGAQLHKAQAQDTTAYGPLESFRLGLNGNYQYANLSVALKLLELLGDARVTPSTVAEGIASVKWPGRLQQLTIPLPDGGLPILLDGAHNGSAAEELAAFVNANLRPKGDIIYVFASTKGKVLAPILGPLFTEDDTVIVTKFSPVSGMPWVSANDPEQLAAQVLGHTDKVHTTPDHTTALELAQKLAEPNAQIVVCGSLYLAADILRLERSLSKTKPDEYVI